MPEQNEFWTSVLSDFVDEFDGDQTATKIGKALTVEGLRKAGKPSRMALDEGFARIVEDEYGQHTEWNYDRVLPVLFRQLPRGDYAENIVAKRGKLYRSKFSVRMDPSLFSIKEIRAIRASWVRRIESYTAPKVLRDAFRSSFPSSPAVEEVIDDYDD